MNNPGSSADAAGRELLTSIPRLLQILSCDDLRTTQ
jgi:hypothetical protein